MERLIRGVERFRSEVFPGKRQLFEALAREQRPEVLFITCSDSRVSPELLTQSPPGVLFTLRNAGNIIPPYDGAPGAEAATIEFAVAALGIRDIVVCGHSACGAMRALLAPEPAAAMPAVRGWLEHARAAADGDDPSLPPDRRWDAVIEANVRLQLEHVRTHPAVAERAGSGALTLHGWVYRIESGEVTVL